MLHIVDNPWANLVLGRILAADKSLGLSVDGYVQLLGDPRHSVQFVQLGHHRNVRRWLEEDL